MTDFQEFTFLSSDGHTQLHGAQWTPADRKPRAVLQIAHGVAEHILRYEPLAAYLTERGFAVAGHDHLGHGLSVAAGAPRLYFGPRGSWDWAVQDLYARRELAGQRFKIYKTASGAATEKAPGTLLNAGKKGVEVACGDGQSLWITELQAEGGKRMSAAAYLLGHPMNI